MKCTTRWLAVLAASLAAFTAAAQTYPTKPVKIVVGFAPGGGSDFIARVIAQQLTGRLGTQVLVENRPGAGSLIGAEFVIKSPADGYTLLLTPASYTVNPSVYKLSFDPLNDITPIVQLSRGPYVVAVNPSVPAKTLQELVALAKREPGKLSYASSGTGAHVHVATEYFLYTAGINIVHVPYKGTGPALNDTIGGNIQLIFGSVATALQHVKSGRLRALAVTTPKRIAAAPDVPTVAESGYPGFQVDNMYGVLAPRGTPPEAVKKLHDDIVRAVREPAAAKALEAASIDIVANTPEEFAAYITSETSKWAQVVKASGAKVE